ncbi:MAG: copper amine oxidase N-terminal domain-containing protein, partial [Syntrophomonadaceae bacterium]|nr:copper amine oxidase N-terminal domain-containing protein [Syntrophomonadaceae bacterium]
MNKKFILILTMLLVFAVALPVIAADNIMLNERSYQSAQAIVNQQGTSMISLDMFEEIIGASVAVENNTIKVNKNDRILTMTLNNQNAIFDGKTLKIPQPPMTINQQIYVPLRITLESYGAEVIWTPDASLAIRYLDKRGEWTAEDLMVESSRRMLEANTYRMDMNMNMNMDMLIKEDGQEVAQKMDAKCDVVAYNSNNPMQLYIVQKIKMNLPGIDTAGIPEITTENIFNEQGMYMKLPEQDWAKIAIEGLDPKTLMQQSSVQDPVAAMKMMKDLGMTTVFANDAERDGKKYYVIRSSAGNNIFQSEAVQEMFNMPGMDQIPQLKEILNNIDLAMEFRTWINQDTLYSDYMDLQGTVSIDLKIPDSGEQMKM